MNKTMRAGAIIFFLAALMRPLVFGVDYIFYFGMLVGGVIFLFGLLSRLEKDSRLGKAAIIIRKTMIGAIIVWFISFLVIESLIVSGSPGDTTAGEEYLIVLGAGLIGEDPSLILQSRLDAANTWLEDNPDSKAILCGGQGPGESITEAEAMYKYLKEAGIDEDRLIIENSSRNTAENISNACRIMASREGDPPSSAAIVSNEFHLYRAKKVAACYGLEASTVSAPTPRVGLLKENSFLREYFSVLLMGFRV